MAASDSQKQMDEAEEILGDSLEQPSFARGLFFGEYHADRMPAYPADEPDAAVQELLTNLKQYCETSIDADAIDRSAAIPQSVIRGLGKLGVLGACLPKSAGGKGMSQTDYCRILEVLGGHCGSTALFVNAHHSIGPRALVLFGDAEQQQKHLPRSATGESITAFALTEPEAGSDAANVQTTAVESPDGKGWYINGEKRWITNGGIADVLTVMARTFVPGANKTKISAFIVTPDMPGFRVVEKRMEKLGVRGTATGRLEFHDMFVPRENLLGEEGKGLKIALTVLDFGRTTFGASCTGAAKFCLQKSIDHVNSRVQFQKTLGEFEMVKEKIAYMQAGVYAMEACTYQTAAMIDSGAGDFMLETAMLKVFSTEVLWKILNDAFQLHGGLAYFTDQPFERMLRDARINTIGEGANDVLRAFSALVGMRDVGLELKSVADAIHRPFSQLSKIGGYASRKLGALLVAPQVPLRSPALEPEATRLGGDLGALAGAVETLLATHQLEIVDRQHLLGRVADAFTEIYVSACVLNRLDAMLRSHHVKEQRRQAELLTGRYYLKTAHRRIRAALASLWNNDDEAANRLADFVLGK